MDNLFTIALKQLPGCCWGNYDALSHTTVRDLVDIAQHELDMYEEGEETDIHTARQAQKVRDYIHAYK